MTGAPAPADAVQAGEEPALPVEQASGMPTYEELMTPLVDPSWPAASCPDLFYPSPGGLRSDAIIIGLGDKEIARAQREGEGRARRHKTHRRKDHFEPADRVANDVQAVGAELAVARWLRVDWIGGSSPDGEWGDAGGFFVRWSRLDCMPIRPTDKAEAIEIFVTGELPVYIIRGWIQPKEAKARPDWYRETPPPYWCVPMAALRSLKTLPGRG